MGLETFELKDFTGGLNTQDGPLALADNEAREPTMNMTLTRRGVLTQRAGKTRFDASGFPADPARADHIRPWYFGSTRLLVASIDGDVYTFDTAGAGTLRFNGTAGTVWCFEQMTDRLGVDYLWMMNGVDTPKRMSQALVVNDWVDLTGAALPNGTMIRVWRNRMVISGVAATPQRLFISGSEDTTVTPDLGNPESFPDLYFIDVRASEDDLDPISWIELMQNDLIVLKKNSVWNMYAEPPSPQLRRIGSPGAESRFQSCVAGERLYYWHRSGLWSTDGQQRTEYESKSIENYIVGSVNHDQVAKIRLATFEDQRIFVAIPTENIYNDRLLEFMPALATRTPEDNRIRGSLPVARHDLPVSAMCTFRIGSEDELMGGASTTNKLHRLFVGSSDDGVAIAARWVSSWKSLFPEEPYERLRRINVLMSGQCTMQIYQDLKDVIKFSDQLISPVDPDGDWDGGVWDGGRWDSLEGPALVRSRPEKRGRYHSLEFFNNVLDESFTIYAIELKVRGGKEH